MPVSDRSRELIQKYFDGLAAGADVEELERLLTADSDVAVAFAEAARLDAGLHDYFRKQYRINQVAALLDATKSTVDLESKTVAEESPASSAHAETSSTSASSESAYIPIDRRLIKRRRSRSWSHPSVSIVRWTSIAAASLLLLVTGIWLFRNSLGERPRMITGHVLVAGQEVSSLPESTWFDVGRNGVEIAFPGGVFMKLSGSTRATIRRESGEFKLQIASGGGQFEIPRRQFAFEVDTVLGAISTSQGRFSLELLTAVPGQISPPEQVRLPRLAVTVADGSVSVRQAGWVTTLGIGEQQFFFSPT